MRLQDRHPPVRATLTGCAMLILCSGALAAQSGDGPAPMVTDRPDFTESAETVPRGRVQLELGATYTEEGPLNALAVGEVLVRIGWTERLELRLGLNSWVDVDLGPFSVDGYEDPSVGVKWKLNPDRDPAAGGPQLALLVSTTIPAGSEEFRNDDPQPSAILAAAWTLSDEMSLGANVGMAVLGESDAREVELSGSVSLGRSFTDQLGGYVELFIISPEESGDQPYADTGVTWLLSKDAQLDFRVGFGLGGDAADYFVGAGATWRW